MLNKASPTDIAMRVQIIEELVELLTEEEVEVVDIEEALDEFMMTNFHTLSDEFSHTEMAIQMLRVRHELTFCAKNDLDMPSGSATLNGLREFNRKNQGQLETMSEYMKQKREEIGESSSDGFESLAGDSQCESYHSDEDMTEEVQEQQESKQTKTVDDDGFE